MARQAAVALAELLHRALPRASRVPQPGGGRLRRLRGLANADALDLDGGRRCLVGSGRAGSSDGGGRRFSGGGRGGVGVGSFGSGGRGFSGGACGVRARGGMCAENVCIGIRCGGRSELRLSVVDFRDEVVAERDEVRFVVDRAVRVDRYAEAGLLREARAVVVDAAEEDVEHEQRGQDEEEVAEEAAQRAGDGGSEKMRLGILRYACRMHASCAHTEGTAQLLREIEEHEKNRRVEQQLHHGEGQQAHYGADAETQHAIHVVGVRIRERG